MVSESLHYYNKVFQNVNKILNRIKSNENLVIFGTNLFFDLFFTYTNLSKYKISFAIDDYPSHKELPFPVITSSQLTNKKIHNILLCLNPIYINHVKQKLGVKNYQLLSPFPK